MSSGKLGILDCVSVIRPRPLPPQQQQEGVRSRVLAQATCGYSAVLYSRVQLSETPVGFYRVRPDVFEPIVQPLPTGFRQQLLFGRDSGVTSPQQPLTRWTDAPRADSAISAVRIGSMNRSWSDSSDRAPVSPFTANNTGGAFPSRMDHIVWRDIVSILFITDRPSLSVCADVMSLCSDQSRSCLLPRNCSAELSNAAQTLSSQIIGENGINIAEFFKMIQIDYGDIHGQFHPQSFADHTQLYRLDVRSPQRWALYRWVRSLRLPADC